MNIKRHFVKMGEGIATWLGNPKTKHMFAIAIGFVWGMSVGIVTTLLIGAGI